MLLAGSAEGKTIYGYWNFSSLNSFTMKNVNVESSENLVMIRTWKGIKKISITDIVYAKSDIQGTKVVFSDGTECDCPCSLSNLIEKLNTMDFFRIHRKYVININCIQEYFNNTATVQLQCKSIKVGLPVARRNKKTFLTAWLKTSPVVL